MNPADIPVLPGYISVARAAVILGMTKESVFYKIYKQGAFKHVYRIPGENDTVRPTLVLLETEVHAVKASEKKAAEYAASHVPLRHRLNQWNRRVKQWGRDGNWTGAIHTHGQPHADLQAAYVSANPSDGRPE